MNVSSQEKQATACFAEGQYAKAAELYGQAIAAAPEVMSNYWHLGLTLLLQGQESEAQMVWLSAMWRGTPEQVELWTAELVEVLDIEARRREVSGDLAEVCLIRQHLGEIAPDYLDNLMKLGKINWGEGKLEEAIAAYNHVIKIQPDCAEAHLNLGNLLKQQGKIGEALTSYKKVLEINPNCPDAFFNIGEIFARQQQLDKAVICLNKAVEIKPDYTEAYLELADILYQQEKVEEVIGCYQKVLEIEPTSTDTYYHLARLYFKQGKNAEGFTLARNALQYHPYNLDLEQIHSPDFWQGINPQLSVSKDGNIKAHSKLIADQKQLQDLLFQLKEEGYFQIDSLIPLAAVERLAVAIERLQQRQIRPVFLLVYDEVWQIFQRLSPLLSAALGSAYQQITFWAWYIDSKKTESGWKPHIDRSSALRPDGMSDTVNVWIALTDATPLNGCMYIVPANFDSSYGHAARQPDFSLQSIRALPVPAGSVLAWNGQVWHWGSRSSSKATHPRISMAMEFQRGDVDPYEYPLLDPFARLSLEERLGLIGLYILSYKQR